MRYLIGLLMCISIFGCHPKTSKNTKSAKSKESKIDTTTGIMNDRLKVTGDFDGDKIIDTLKESFISSIDGKETNKYPEADYDSAIVLTMNKKPICRLISKNLSPLIVNKDEFQLFGLAFLKNEGDLDKDGADELGLIVDWADWSSVNGYRVYTYKNKKWTELFNFEIRDFEIPDSKGNKDLLYHDKNGNLIAKVWELGEQKEKKIDLKK